jgi:hypothetical protein
MLTVLISSMTSAFRSKRILKPDVPPPRMNESPGRLGKGLIIAVIGVSCAAVVVSLIYMVR